MTSNRDEAQTRTEIIDSQLSRSGWSRSRRTLMEEFLLKTAEPEITDKDYQFADYILLGSDGKPIAVVEAKRSSRDVLAGKRQAADYADAIKNQFGSDPFIFLTNGKEIQFWDRARYAPRKISGFYTRDDLERLRHQHQFAEPVGNVTINADIAGRDYQNEAIRRVTEGVDAAKRKFLLVMATGTGKTRTTIALVDTLLRSKRVQRVLFLADRRELVRQAMSEFKSYLPNESLARIESGETSGARIQFSTYPSMMQVYSRLSVGYYDLIVADESHRSIYQRYKAIFDHFDAIQLGLTATPTDYIDHNTFELFDCGDGAPSYYYSYEQAIADQNLVNYRVLDAQTNFQLQGIQGDTLPGPLKQMARDQGVDLDELNFDGSDIEKGIINQGTNDAMVKEFMDKSRKDIRGLPHKSIIFAVSHAHAKRLYEGFNRLYPELQRQGMAEIIDSHMERADVTLDDFKYRTMPRVVISVDMLDTGVDVPAIQNLVFAKPVFSKVKFWQMIGRGTRLHIDKATGEIKKDFLIIDHWKNFAYFKLKPDGEVEYPSEPLPVRLFRLRLEKWLLLHSQQQDTQTTIAALLAMLDALPRHSINVRPHWDALDTLVRQWPEPSQSALEHLSRTIAPLMRFALLVCLEELQFRIWCERLTVAYLKGDALEQTKVQERIQEAVSSLADNIPEVQRVAEQRVWVQSTGFWQHLNTARLSTLQSVFSPLMRYRTSIPSRTVEINLPDSITQRSWIIYGPTGEGAFAESYREQVEALVRRLVGQLPEIAKLKQGEHLDDEELDQVSKTLNQTDLFVTEDTLRKAFEAPAASLADFLRHILCEGAHLPNREQRINAAFEAFIAAHGYLRANQLNFLRAVKAAVLRHGSITRAALGEPPLSRVGRVETLFPQQDIDELINLANQLLDDVA
ncbi:TPA: DEAD/DEAH box helicase family protein [Klebsiella aerogenes]|uniref:type I restriction endonuclease subunit R n=1 Tax=Enterobacteriaceae TaxID=543 RepID=UPI000669804E|nr:MULTISPECIES: type I restriction endonuclease subunit R [Enterobacteriaceae]HDH0785343.1 DEAD/DEAH box helicase family protein [Klebsiella oxytoca]MBQ4926351.1 DEAD/DEAH box helicase [Citrobacter werkmanii]MBQ4938651.1 DEAD/DEAH box helicase [Citrobacter werkmanii]MBQ4951497.1 DEAD/DEAH box helicase [Citrobacter werkmanii]MBQ4967382.1 DEAD/DEAH box helicase [Citrobacter werkmanii]